MRTAATCLLVFVVALLVAGPHPALAQPIGEEVYLLVRTESPSGAPAAVAPRVSLQRLVADRPVPTRGTAETTPDLAAVITGLVPGEYDIRMTLPGYGLKAEPLRRTLGPGVNVVRWRIPDPQNCLFALGPQGDVPETLDACQVHLFAAGEKAGTAVPARYEEGRLTVPGLYPGRYTLCVVTEVGWGTAAFTVAADPQETPVTRIPLEPVGGVRFLCTLDGEPFWGAGIYLQVPVADGLSITYHANSEGDGLIVYPLTPTGPVTWRTMFGHGYRVGSGTIPPGDPVDIAIAIPPRPAPRPPKPKP